MFVNLGHELQRVAVNNFERLTRILKLVQVTSYVRFVLLLLFRVTEVVVNFPSDKFVTESLRLYLLFDPFYPLLILN